MSQPKNLGPILWHDGTPRTSYNLPLHIYEYEGRYWAHVDDRLVGKEGGLWPASMLEPYIRALGETRYLNHEWFAVSVGRHRYDLMQFGTYAIVAQETEIGIAISSYPSNLEKSILYDLVEPMLAAWPSVKVDEFNDYLVIKFRAPDDETAATFGFAGTGVYATCTEGVYRLHKVDPQ